MSTITKELAKLFRKITNSEIDAEGNAHVVLSPADSLLINNARIALASLEAEPVAWLLSGGGAKNHVSFDSGNAYADPLREVTPLYTAPPAPVSVPDYPETLPCTVMLEPGLRFGKGVKTHLVLEALKRRAEYYAELEAMTPEQRAEHDAGMKEFAAMLQGAEPVTTTYKLPFEQWLSQKDEPIDVDCGCVTTEAFYHWLRVAYEDGNSPVIPDGSKEALSDAVAAIYFNDSSDYFSALWSVVRALSPETAELLANNEKAAFDATRPPAAPQQEVK